MTDLACWRCHDGYVVRIHGSEHWLAEAEIGYLLTHLLRVQSGEGESLSEDYLDLCITAEARKQPADLISRLGLRKQGEPLRRI